jgi:hypothetical protein
MRANRLLSLTLALAFAAAAGPALACGPMSGSSGSSSGGSGRGGYDNGAAERQRQGADTAAGANLGDGDNGGGRRASPDAGRDLSGQISAIAAAEGAQDAQDQPESQHPKKPLVSLGDIPGAFDAKDPDSPPPGTRNTFMNGDTDKNPDWLAWNSLPWWDRLDADAPRMSNHPIARPFDPIVTGTCTPEFKDRDFEAEARQAQQQAAAAVREANDPAAQKAFRDAQAARAKQFPPQAPPERPKSAAWLEWNDKSWIERQFEDEPPMYPKNHNIAEPGYGAGAGG